MKSNRTWPRVSCAAAIVGVLFPVLASAVSVFPRPDYGPGTFRTTVVIAQDFNGDGRKDFVTIDSGTLPAFLVLTRPEGGFLPPQPLPLDAGYRQFIAGDFNGDGRMDIAVLANVTSALGTMPVS